MPALSERRLVLTYILALGLIAALSLASHLALDQILRQQKGSAAVVNLAGRQRMLSQRIASLVAQLQLGNQAARADLTASIDRFETAHNDLLHGNPTVHVPPATSDPALMKIYFGGAHPLDAEVGSYIRQARRLALSSPHDPGFSKRSTPLFLSARAQILEDLNAAVTVHERESEQQLAFLDVIQNVMLIIVLGTLLFEALAIFQPMIQRIMHNAKELMRLATTDPLTGALNRRSFFARGTIELERTRRYKRPMTVLMIDADHFKRINDAFGHDGGDAVLIALTKTLAEGLRVSDLLGRLGGEEFAIVLPETGLDAAELLANRLRTRIGELRVATSSGTATFTISIGAAEIDLESTELAPILERADKALYEAKESGRNRVVTSKSSTARYAGSAPRVRVENDAILPEKAG